MNRIHLNRTNRFIYAVVVVLYKCMFFFFKTRVLVQPLAFQTKPHRNAVVPVLTYACDSYDNEKLAYLAFLRRERYYSSRVL
jgi:hypothetical protein